MLNALLNGQRITADQPVLYADERGYHYGDGVFETMLLHRGRVRFITDHWQRLQRGCSRLQMPQPDQSLLESELALLTQGHGSGVVKLLISRGRSERGYRPAQSSPTRLWQLFAAPLVKPVEGICVRWCNLRLARNPFWAGIKHCNRLEQVMAQAEWRDASIGEGLMLDTEGELVAGTLSNVFLVLDDTLVTPDLRYCGIQGILRKNVLQLAEQLGMPCEQRAVRAEELQAASEVFMTNAVRGIQPVVQLEQRCWSVGSMTRQLMAALENLL